MKNTILETIRNAHTFEIITHSWPDEDAVGSSMALAHVLDKLGKSVRVIYPTPAPERMLMAPYDGPQPKAAPEVSLYLDVSDPKMTGSIVPQGQVAVIDHHRSNTGYGQVTWVDPEMSSTSEMILVVAQELGITPDVDIATNIYMGIFGDTGGFMHPNTNLRVFETTTRLIRHGADPHAISDRLKRNKPLAWYHVLCATLERLQIVQGVFASYLTEEDFARLQALPTDASGIIEELASMAGAELSIFIRDIDRDKVHCSLRSRTTPAALKTSQAFGGGGHNQAAGFTIKGRAEELFEHVLKEGIKWTQAA